jgi:hypothetical protein
VEWYWGENRRNLGKTHPSLSTSNNTVLRVTIFGKEYKLRISSLCSFLWPPVTSALIGPNILLSILLSEVLNLCSSLNVKDQVSLQKLQFCFHVHQAQ